MFGFEAGELGGDAGLDVEFEVFRAGAVRLWTRLKSTLLARCTCTGDVFASVVMDADGVPLG